MFDEIATKTLEKCRVQGLSVATAESCTGGLIAGALTAITGSSDVVDRGFVTYSNQAKNEMLDVSEDDLNRFGAVSDVVAKEMAEGGLKAAGTDLCVAVTGIAGPGGGSKEKPVGLVYLACARKGADTIVERQEFDGDRDAVRAQTVERALELLMIQSDA
ncbi:CinA family protein [Terasakiella sp. A23]|uniref:CinA family protein n=1 Tax=Terasakiella sp. FCG-A23 TaxID=3080561 RepID=UPI002955506F|nr:CinA family protein [Terasakiella sp. A23]MDV7341444.1 CinA family protein [Terasakiella sp. A23]